MDYFFKALVLPHLLFRPEYFIRNAFFILSVVPSAVKTFGDPVLSHLFCIHDFMQYMISMIPVLRYKNINAVVKLICNAHTASLFY